MKKRYNGYCNYDTWKVALWLLNDERNYRIAKNTKDVLMRLNLFQLKRILKKYFYFGDSINWSNVRKCDIIEVLKDL